jgi:hypothetical protein
MGEAWGRWGPPRDGALNATTHAPFGAEVERNVERSYDFLRQQQPTARFLRPSTKRHLLNFRATSREIFLGQGAEPFIVEYLADGIALIVMTEGKANSSDSRSDSLHLSGLNLRPKRPPSD